MLLKPGMRFTKLVIVQHDRGKGYLCQCDCGNRRYAGIGPLKDGFAKSCGCLKKERAKAGYYRLPGNLGLLRRLYRDYVRKAAKRNIAFKLKFDVFAELANASCFYCGAYRFNKSRKGRYQYDVGHSGVDRVDPNKGYTDSNCVPCCGPCNLAKRSMTLSEFKEWVSRVHKNMSKIKGNAYGRTRKIQSKQTGSTFKVHPVSAKAKRGSAEASR